MEQSNEGGVQRADASEVERTVRLGQITDKEIAQAFEGSNFGPANHRHLLAMSVLKKALKYHCGHTITQIMVSLKLTTKAGRVTERGRLFCYEQLDVAGRA